MNDIIILVIAMGTVAVLVVKAFSLLSNEITRLHRDIRKVREYAFWSQKREREARKILRKQ